MDCKNISKKLIFYAENNLPEQDKKLVEKHISSCNKCKQELLIIQQAFGIINDEKNLQVNPYIYTRIMAKTEQKNTSKIIKYVFRPVAVSMIILMGIWFGHKASDIYFKNQENNILTEEQQFTEQNEIYVVNDISYEDYYFITNQ